MQLSGYYVGDIIGQGGMATVYRAQHLLLQQERALKVMSPELTNQPGFKESFIREGQFIAALKHPNIVSIYDISEQNGVYFMAMEYLHGGSLEEKLPLSLDETIRVLKQIGGALYYAHQQKIIHRDIKPANILFNAKGDAILTDFGISKVEDTESELTLFGYGIVGTMRYMSPEQTDGERLDQRSDLYSFALVFYEMLSGEKAIKSDTRSSIMREHAIAPAPTLPQKYSFLQSVLNKALAKTADQRYLDMRAFVEAVLIEKTKHELAVKEKKNRRLFLIKSSSLLLIIGAIYLAFILNPAWIEKMKPQHHPTQTVAKLPTNKIEPVIENKAVIPEPKKEEENNITLPDTEPAKTIPVAPIIPKDVSPKQPLKKDTENIALDSPNKKESKPKHNSVDEIQTATILNTATKIKAIKIASKPTTLPKHEEESLSKKDQANTPSKEKIIKAQPVLAETQTEPQDKIPNETKISPIYKTVRVSPYIFLYNQPNGKRMSQLAQGTRIQIIATLTTENGKDWAKLELNNQYYYVKTSQLK